MKKQNKKSKEEPVEILVIADRSGSMYSIKEDAIGGFNTFLKEQQKIKGKANLSLMLFNDSYETIIDSKNINDVTPLTESTYIPEGTTAMNDAICDGINKLKGKNPKRAIICILTDGLENSSKENTTKTVKEVIESVKEKNWEVVYLAANQDAFSEGNIRGILNNYNYDFSSSGIRSAYSNISSTTTNYRTNNTNTKADPS